MFENETLENCVVCNCIGTWGETFNGYLTFMHKVPSDMFAGAWMFSTNHQ